MPISKVLKDNGILRVGKKYAEKLANDPADPWFEMLGESSTALLLKLYSQVSKNDEIAQKMNFQTLENRAKRQSCIEVNFRK